MSIRREGSLFVLRSKKTGKVLGKHETMAAARKQDIAITLSKRRKRGQLV